MMAGSFLLHYRNYAVEVCRMPGSVKIYRPAVSLDWTSKVIGRRPAAALEQPALYCLHHHLGEVGHDGIHTNVLHSGRGDDTLPEVRNKQWVGAAAGAHQSEGISFNAEGGHN